MKKTQNKISGFKKTLEGFISKTKRLTHLKRQKKEGFIVIIAVMVSAIVLTIGAGAARLFIQEIDFSSDVYLSEKAIFAAESGVEIALLELKKNPVQHIENEIIDLGDAGNTVIHLDIKNRTKTMKFSLETNQSQKFHLNKDTENGSSFSQGFADSFDLEITPASKDFEWKFLCKDGSGNTKILTQKESSGNFTDFFAHPDSGGTKFSDWKTSVGIEEKTCFFQVKNLAPESLEFSFKFSDSSKNMTSYQALIKSTGKSGGREKTIEFKILQKNLGSLFDFVLFHY